MVTIQSQEGKYYFSDTVFLASGETTTIDENALSIYQLKDMLSAIKTGRLLASEEDTAKIQLLVNTKTSGGGGGSFDPSVLEPKEDKANKTETIGEGSTILYPTTSAVLSFVNTELSGYVKSSTLGVASGVATLDATGKVLSTQLPAFTGVTSVNTKTGAVTLAKADIGLSNVDNTSDANKPISTAAQTALNLKAAKDVATASADGLMSAADKAKLNGIAAGANLFALPVGTNGQVLKHDGLVWKAADDLNTTYSKATTSADGLMSKEDKTKLDGIDAIIAALTARVTSAEGRLLPETATEGDILTYTGGTWVATTPETPAV